MDFLIIAAIIAIIIAVSILFVIVRMIRRRWSSGYGYTRAHYEPGERGEMTVARILKRLPESGYRVANDLLFVNSKGNSTQIDHVVVSEYGIFVIETKDYKGWISGHQRSEYWTQTLFGKRRRYGFGDNMDRHEFRNPISQNEGHIRVLRKVLGDSGDVPIYSIVVFPPWTTLNVTAPTECVIQWNGLTDAIKSVTTPVLSREKVDELYSKIVSSRSHFKEDRAKHISNVRRYQEATDNAVASGICPKCGGKLVLRSGKYGRFYGCSNYPKCTYTHRPD